MCNPAAEDDRVIAEDCTFASSSGCNTSVGDSATFQSLQPAVDPSLREENGALSPPAPDTLKKSNGGDSKGRPPPLLEAQRKDRPQPETWARQGMENPPITLSWDGESPSKMSRAPRGRRRAENGIQERNPRLPQPLPPMLASADRSSISLEWPDVAGCACYYLDMAPEKPDFRSPRVKVGIVTSPLARKTGSRGSSPRLSDVQDMLSDWPQWVAVYCGKDCSFKVPLLPSPKYWSRYGGSDTVGSDRCLWGWVGMASGRSTPSRQAVPVQTASRPSCHSSSSPICRPSPIPSSSLCHPPLRPPTSCLHIPQQQNQERPQGTALGPQQCLTEAGGV